MSNTFHSPEKKNTTGESLEISRDDSTGDGDGERRQNPSNTHHGDHGDMDSRSRPTMSLVSKAAQPRRLALTLAVALLTLAGCLSAQAGALRASSLFGDSMVLQAGAETSFFGAASPGSLVQLLGYPGSATASVRADPDTGEWLLRMPPAPPSRGGDAGLSLRLQSGAEELVAKDVVFGDVLLCSGQSNMALPLNIVYNASA